MAIYEMHVPVVPKETLRNLDSLDNKELVELLRKMMSGLNGLATATITAEASVQEVRWEDDIMVFVVER